MTAYVVKLEDDYRIYGPFATRDEADDWASAASRHLAWPTWDTTELVPVQRAEREAFATLRAALDIDTDEPLAVVLNEAAATIEVAKGRIARAISTLLFPPYTPEDRARRALTHLGYTRPAGMEREAEL